ncbi:unnamed protein product [Notodromas monacha]|uniref:Transmembrane 9 superfamily member n=1 Tax=Notodromas monacha TaxID=399045 RepID=A0A7R9BCI5_9CRUS|nr:unnamed protein product [Notodromas monacha]CAG0912809.1 unnamed protein product [Notodromas monacha]
MNLARLFWARILVSILYYAVSADANKAVDIFVNKVGPFRNPHETYLYYSLPLCRPETIKFRSMSVGQALDGNKLAYSDFRIKFLDVVVYIRIMFIAENVESRVLCVLNLTAKEVEFLRRAIDEQYYFEFFVQDRPVGGYLGETMETSLLPHTHEQYLFKHIVFTFYHNNKEILSACLKMEDPVSLKSAENMKGVSYSYSARWNYTELSPDEMAVKVNKLSKNMDRIHWISIINSVALNILLVIFISAILAKMLGRELSSGVEGAEEGDVKDSEATWKRISADVFRYPKFKRIFCAVVGAGSQFLVLISGLVVMGIMRLFDVANHGAATSTGCVLFAFTCIIAGYVSGALYKMMDGDKWVSLVNVTAALFVGPFFVVWAVDNCVAWSYGSTQALPVSILISLVALWMFVGYPLTVIGSLLGKNLTSTFEPPCRTKNVPREIPPSPIYSAWPGHIIFGGCIPCSAIAVELYYIFGAVWGREEYTLYGLLLIMMMMLIFITASVSICLTYSLLVAEDYRWWWRSVFSVGASAGFMFIYAVLYVIKRTEISGLLQISQFLSWTLSTCYAFFLAVGSVSFFASFVFVRFIYRSVKLD